MPLPFRRRDRISADFIAVPAEQPVPDEVRIADLDSQAYEAFRAGDMATADRLIDLRNAIRPAKEPRPVPVVPGRVDSIIDNYWENP
jgi:hypothetical protein